MVWGFAFSVVTFWLLAVCLYIQLITFKNYLYCGLLLLFSPSVIFLQLFPTPWTLAYQVSLSMGFSRQEYWSGLPFPSPGNLPDPGIEPGSPALQMDSLLLSHKVTQYKTYYFSHIEQYSPMS